MSGWPRRRNEIRSRERGHGRQRDKGSVVEVHFQTEHLGWNTDDLLEGREGVRLSTCCLHDLGKRKQLIYK